MLLPLLLGCSFVVPPPPEVELDPPQATLERIDELRKRMLGTDPGVELWRSIDAHGGLLRYERIGPLTAHLDDGRIVGPDHPLHPYLTRPFSLADEAVDPESRDHSDHVVVHLLDDTLVHLDAVDRTLLGWEEGEANYEVLATRHVQGLRLIDTLSLPGDETMHVDRWEATSPLPGWPAE